MIVSIRLSHRPQHHRRTKAVESFATCDQPAEHVVSKVRRYTRLSLSALLHAVFGIDEQTRSQAGDMVSGALELALETAVQGGVLEHPGVIPTMRYLNTLLPHAGLAAPALGSISSAANPT